MGIVNKDRNLFQYRNATRIQSLQNSFYDIAKSTSPDNLERFFNYDLASGDWLTQLAALFNVERYYFERGTAFILDVSLLDSGDVLDGINAPLDDNLLRAFLLAKILSNTGAIKSVPYMYTVFNYVIKPYSIEITEGTKTLTITIDCNGDTEVFRKINALYAFNQRWFGCPTGVSVTYVIIP